MNIKNNIFYKFLVYLTNNEKQSKHEIQFDIVFFILTIIFFLWGYYIFFRKGMIEWIPVLGLETIWCIDSIRHNRE